MKTNFRNRQEWLASGLTEQEASEKCKRQREYSTAIHEAGHGVMHCRTIQAKDTPLQSLEIFDEGTRRKSAGSAGFATGIVCVIATVAGHFAEYRWGWVGRKNSWNFGGSGDFESMVRDRAQYRHYCIEAHYDGSNPRVKKVDKVSAGKQWAANMRKLSALARRDPSFEIQVRAVADALVEKRRLSGEEVLAIMTKAQ